MGGNRGRKTLPYLSKQKAIRSLGPMCSDKAPPPKKIRKMAIQGNWKEKKAHTLLVLVAELQKSQQAEVQQGHSLNLE